MLLVGSAAVSLRSLVECAGVGAQIIECRSNKFSDGVAFARSFADTCRECVRTNRRTVFLVQEQSAADLVYADYLCSMLSCIDSAEVHALWLDQEFLSSLTRALPNEHLQKLTEEQRSTETKKRLRANLRVAVCLTSLQTYFAWVSHYPQLETMFSVRFVAEEQQLQVKSSGVAKCFASLLSEVERRIRSTGIKTFYDKKSAAQVEQDVHLCAWSRLASCSEPG